MREADRRRRAGDGGGKKRVKKGYRPTEKGREIIIQLDARNATRHENTYIMKSNFATYSRFH